MKVHQNALRQEHFDALLGLFSHDRDEAGRAYESLRTGLVRFFEFRGCSDSDALADETLNRVALKAMGFDNSKNVKVASYVYGFAANVFLEYRRSPRRREFVGETDDILHNFKAPEVKDDREPTFACLQGCLGKLDPIDHSLFIEYYSREKQEKIELRKDMAKRLGCTVEALHTRVFRLKSSLRACVTRCLSG